MLFMKQEYLVGRELTPPHLACGIGACPAIYEAIRQDGIEQDCILGACPEIKPRDNGYAIVGTLLTSEQVKSAGLEGKVAPHEAVVFVPKGIIDERRN